MKRWCALFLVLVMVFTLTGCGIVKNIVGKVVDFTNEDPGDDPGDDHGDDPWDDPGDEPGDDPGDVPVGLDGEFYSYEGDNAAYLMLLDFRELRFTWLATSPDETSDWTYTQKYVGDEEVDGVTAKKFEVTIAEVDATTVTELWLSPEGQLLKAGMDGEYATGDMAMIYSLCLFYAFPVWAYTGFYYEAFEEGEFNYLGWELSEKTTETRNYGAGNVPAERYVFTFTWDDERAEYEWEIAKIKGKYLFTKWKLNENDGNAFNMIVDTAIPF